MIDRIRQNLIEIRERMRAAALRCNRPPEAVQLIGVTKYVDAPTTAMLAAAGCLKLGENRPQTLWEKSAELNDPKIEWHLIGHLQRNKIKRTIDIAALIHSIDSRRLLTAIDSAGNESNRVVDVLLEINVSGETAKHGFDPTELGSVVDFVATLANIRVKGLMCMAGLASNQADTRREFSTLRVLSQKHSAGLPDNVRLNELSMGMSDDFEMAIEEGATLVRIGSLLFDSIT